LANLSENAAGTATGYYLSSRSAIPELDFAGSFNEITFPFVALAKLNSGSPTGRFRSPRLLGYRKLLLLGI
jgi:hypothetical protein